MVDDPAFMANRLITQMLGSMHLARVGLGIHEASPGVAASFEIDDGQMRDACVHDAMALLGATAGARS